MSDDQTIEIYPDHAGEWRWRQRATNGQVTAVAGEGYTRREDVIRALDTAMPGRTWVEVEA